MLNLHALRVNIASMRSAGMPLVQLHYDQVEQLIEAATRHHCSCESPSTDEGEA
jgi:hypothetical protein